MDILFLGGEESHNIIGCYANIEAFAAVVVTVFKDNSRYEIIDCLLRRRLGLKPIADDLLELSKNHKVKHLSGNSIAETVYSGGTLDKDYAFSVDIQWETTDINVEKMLFLTECYLTEDRLKIAANIENALEKELRYFDLRRYVEDRQASHRLFAYFHAITAARPVTPAWTA